MTWPRADSSTPSPWRGSPCCKYCPDSRTDETRALACSPRSSDSATASENLRPSSRSRIGERPSSRPRSDLTTRLKTDSRSFCFKPRQAGPSRQLLADSSSPLTRSPLGNRSSTTPEKRLSSASLSRSIASQTRCASSSGTSSDSTQAWDDSASRTSSRALASCSPPPLSGACSTRPQRRHPNPPPSPASRRRRWRRSLTRRVAKTPPRRSPQPRRELPHGTLITSGTAISPSSPPQPASGCPGCPSLCGLGGPSRTGSSGSSTNSPERPSSSRLSSSIPRGETSAASLTPRSEGLDAHPSTSSATKASNSARIIDAGAPEEASSRAGAPSVTTDPSPSSSASGEV